VTSDCPFNEAALVDEIVDVIQQKQFDYCSTGAEYPDGVDVEVFSFDLLRKAWQNATLRSDREHVTPFIKRAAQQSGKFFMVACPFNLSHIRMTVDEKKDFDAISHLSAVLGTSRDWLSYANYIDQHPGEFANQQIARNEGYLKSIKHDEQNN
jgi:spore coat polysaccharide biosynthesis protein SpsF (cytidylyltransferase family)